MSEKIKKFVVVNTKNLGTLRRDGEHVVFSTKKEAEAEIKELKKRPDHKNINLVAAELGGYKIVFPIVFPKTLPEWI